MSYVDSVLVVLGKYKSHMVRIILSFLFILSFSVCLLPGQTLARQVVASQGQSHATANAQISWTLGEMVTATWRNNTVVLSQGFQQPLSVVSSLEEETEPAAFWVAQRNGQNWLQLEAAAAQQATELHIFDLQGRLCHRQALNAQQQVLLPVFNHAPYLLRIRQANGATSQKLVWLQP